jgi:uncharacterized protein
MSTAVFINLPVRDVERSTAFYRALGFSLDPQFTDEKAACIVISEHIHVMALAEAFFATFTKKPVADATTSAQVIVALSRDSRADVDETLEKALAAGGRPAQPALDHGFMYEQSFEDPDGHLWSAFWMDPAHLQSASA